MVFNWTGLMRKILFLFIACFLHVSADTHSLQQLYTAVTSEIHFTSVEFTAVDLLNGEQITSYNSNNQTLIPKDWIKNIKDETYWKSKTQDIQGYENTFTSKFTTVMEYLNHSNEGHTLQRMYGCERDDDNITRGYDVYSYDGEDFISLDLKTGTWTAVSAKAVNIKHKWTSKEAKYWKNYLENECVDWFAYDNTVPPTASVFQKHSSPELVCHATGFFPKTVMITWQKDGEDVHEDVYLGETLPNQDGTFQKRSILTVSAEDLQEHTYTCVIQHSSLEKEIVLHEEDIRILKPGRGLSRGRIGVIAAVAVVFIAIVAGIVVWKRSDKDSEGA